MLARQFRKAKIAALALTLLAMSSVAAADDLIAVVDLKFIEATDEPAAYFCVGDEDEDCGVWATFNIYKARIRKIIKGTESRKTLLVMFGRHALGHNDHRGVIARLNKLEAEQPTDPQYQIVGLGREREMVCFYRRDDDTGGAELKEQDEQPLTCYDTKPQD